MPHRSEGRTSVAQKTQDLDRRRSRAKRFAVEGPPRAGAAGSASDQTHPGRPVPLVVVSPHQYDHAYFRADDPANYLG